MVFLGSVGSFSISGNCSGTGDRTDAPAATVATFEGVAGYSAVGIIHQFFTNCTPDSSDSTYTSYYDLNYTPLGHSDGYYGVSGTSPFLPVSAIVGDAGMVGTEWLYPDDNKAVSSGQKDISYVIEADTADSAIVNLTTKIYDKDQALISTVQDRYRITTNGSEPLVPVSSDIQTPNASAKHLVWTYN